MASGIEVRSMVRYETREGVAYVTLDAPPLNILTGELMLAIAAAVESANADGSLKAIALTAAGRAFSAGADIGEHEPARAPQMIGAFSRLFDVMSSSALPVVMAVDGAALGAGFELVLMADVLLASERATFGQPEIRLGFFAPLGVSLLPARVGVNRALEITCTGRVFGARQMAEFGIVSRVVAAEELHGEMEAVLGDMRRASPAVMRMNVALTRRLHAERQPLDEARHEAERVFLDELMALDDVREGIAAFYEKRQPVWTNR
jgi:cyclohexa-1,5-dienecarbonyl-CoA hydratase